jgi:hypothetical protein
VILTAFYSWRILQYKTAVGGWWNILLGERPLRGENQAPVAGGGRRPWGGKGMQEKGESVEDRINALADALGIPSKDLASAIAVAVREHIPPASLSSVKAQETGSGVINNIVGEREEGQDGGIAAGVVSGIDSMVGMDEPPDLA